jgi:CubicO group peptidase (beta-lactamase class C family)/D-alanyl-D-alanine dipeptidase
MKPRVGFFVGMMVLGLLVRPQQVVGQETVPPVEKYTQAAKALEAYITAEMAAKEVPGLAIALVDGRQVVWARGFGFADVDKKKPVTAKTVFPMGQVSQPITALLLLILAREGKVDLDAPVTKCLPEFKPKSEFKEPITIRHLLAQWSGLVKEPPVGNSFDPGQASRKALVESLNDTNLTHRPGEKVKASNAAFATAGYLLETVAKQPFEDFAAERIFTPLEMRSSSFRLTDKVKAQLAVGNGWSQYGRTFPYPLVDHPALAPALGLYSNVNDMSKFIPALYPTKDKGPFRAEELKAAFSPRQDEKVQGQVTFGLGFRIFIVQEKRGVEKSGSVNGCTTMLAVLPDEHLGVIVCANKGTAGFLLRKIASAALGQALAVRAGNPLPKLEPTTPLKPGLAKTLTGHFRADSEEVEINAIGDRAWLAWEVHGYPELIELRSLGDEVIGDDLLHFDPKVAIKEDGLEIDGRLYRRYTGSVPKSIPEKWQGLIGEYGSDTDVVFVLEKDGKLNLLKEWFYLNPLKEDGTDRFRFPSTWYGNEEIVFHRPSNGKAGSVTVGGVKFKRRVIDGEDGSTFRIKPLRPIDNIRKEALAATPPVEKGEFRKPDLVDLAKVEATIKQDIRYASDNNFMGVPLYTSAKAFVQRPVAEALVRAHKKLADKGYGILVFDAYRPWYVTKMFWEATPEAQRIFVADPSKGSRHNRGCAIDITLYNLKTGKPVEMVSGYDEFSDRAYPEYPGGTSLQRYYRTLLRETMAAEGFTVYEAEWWHFDYKDWRSYPILNRRFEDLP